MKPGWFQKTYAPWARAARSASRRSVAASAAGSSTNSALKWALPTGDGEAVPGTGRVISAPGIRISPSWSASGRATA